MIVGVDQDEWYPVYGIDENVKGWFGLGNIELTQEEVDRIKKAFDEFKKIQDLIEDKLEKRDAVS